jgi:hypothetical protein
MIGEQEAHFRWRNSLREDFLGSLPAVECLLVRGHGGRAVGFVLSVLVITLCQKFPEMMISRDKALSGLIRL